MMVLADLCDAKEVLRMPAVELQGTHMEMPESVEPDSGASY